MLRNMLDTDLRAAVAIAVVVIAIATCCWPGFAKIDAKDLEGHWVSKNGTMFEIIPGPGVRDFTVRSAGAKGVTLLGSVFGVRAIHLGGRVGWVGIGRRRISWPGKEVWSRQGV